MRYQHGLPRRVLELSMMSSDTRKKAWSSSMNQPSRAAWKNSSSVSLRLRSSCAVSMTERPRLHLPPSVLWYKDCSHPVSELFRPFCCNVPFSFHSFIHSLIHSFLPSQVGRTFSNQVNACSGSLYFIHSCFKSSTSFGNTLSNSFNVAGILNSERYRWAGCFEAGRNRFRATTRTGELHNWWSSIR